MYIGELHLLKLWGHFGIAVKLSLLLYLDGYEIQSYRHKDGLSFPVNFLFCFLMFLELDMRNWLLPNTHRGGGNRKRQ